MVHLTEKPVELAVRAIEYSSRPGESVLDLFGGSGSTLIAAEQTGRRAFLMEVDPLYVDVVLQRFIRFVGDPARVRLVSEGEEVAYEAVSSLRRAQAAGRVLPGQARNSHLTVQAVPRRG